MASNDVRGMGGRKPTGQRGQQLVGGYVSLNQTAPAAFSDTLYVVIPSLLGTNSTPFPGGEWPECHGATLPTAGTYVLLGYDERRTPSVVTWGGQYQF